MTGSTSCAWILTPSLLLAIGCGGNGGGAEPAAIAAAGAQLVSPSDGAVIRVGWVPVAVRVPQLFIDARVTTRVDGQDVTDPLGIFSNRVKRPEAGRYLATLDLDTLDAGPHAIEVEFVADSGERAAVHGRFELDRPPCELDLAVVDGRGAPSSARIAVFRDGRPYLLVGPDAAAVDSKGRDTQLHSTFVVGGSGRLFLDPGRYELLAVRGVRQDVAERTVDLGADCRPLAVRFEIADVIPTPGVVTADLHVHTGSSSDAHVPDVPRYRSLVAADLDVVVISDHNRITDPRRALEATRATAHDTQGIAGVEARIGPRRPSESLTDRVGHANFFPLAPGAPLPKTDSRDLAEYIDLYRERQRQNPDPQTGSDLLVQLNHARGLTSDPTDDRRGTYAYALFTYFSFDRKVPLGQGVNAWLTAARPGTGTTPLDFDSFEVLNRFSWGPYLETRADWFLLMNLGYTPTATGNSDSHALAVEIAGLPVNLVHAPDAIGADGELDRRAFIEAVRGGRVSVSCGPIVELRVLAADGRSAVPGDTLAARGPVRAQVEVRAAPWVPVHEVRLVVDGRLARREPLEHVLPQDGETLRASLEWTVELERDGWIVAEAGWPIDGASTATGVDLGTFARVAPGYLPLAFTNAVRIDADGDGVWTPLAPERAAELAEPMPPAPPPPREDFDGTRVYD